MNIDYKSSEKETLEEKLALTQFSRELELLHLQHRQSFYYLRSR